jgi:peptidoglycan/LPS O-acetylase OafA/YrhL
VNGRDARPTLRELTGLRFFAALWVLCFHALPRSDATPPLWLGFWDAGYTGVTLFFILSGFVLVYSYGPGDGTTIDARSFWGARVARLYPVYIAALVIGLPEFVRMTAGVPGIPPATPAETITTVITTPLMLHAWLPTAYCRWNCPGWTLSVEAFFYLLFPLAAPLLRGKSARALLAVAATAAALIFVASDAWFLAPAFIRPTELVGGDGIFPHSPLLRFPEFLLGMAAGRWYLDRRRIGLPLHRQRGRIAAALSVVTIVVVAAMHAGRMENSTLVAVLAVPYACLILACAEGPGGLLALPVVTLPGESSYALYIIHGPLHVYTLGLARRLVPGSLTSHPWLVFFVYLGTVLVCSVLLHRYLERPARRALRRRMVASPVLP